MSGLRITMKRGPIPLPRLPLPPDDEGDQPAEARQEPTVATGSSAGPPAALPSTDPPPAPTPQGSGNDPGASPGASVSHREERSETASVEVPRRPLPPHVAALRVTVLRLQRDLAQAEERLPVLAAAVATARTASKERAVAAVIEATSEAGAATKAASGLLEEAIEAESAGMEAVGVLRVALQRVERELKLAVERLARDDEREVLAALDATADRDAASCLAALDRLFTRARLRGQHSAPQSLLGAVFGVRIGAPAMITRSSQLYVTILNSLLETTP